MKGVGSLGEYNLKPKWTGREQDLLVVRERFLLVLRIGAKRSSVSGWYAANDNQYHVL